MYMILMILLTSSFALTYRMRGGAVPLGSTQAARLVFWFLPNLLLATVVSHLTHAPFYIALMSATLAFVTMLIGHGFAQSENVAAYRNMGLVTFTRMFAMYAPFVLWSKAVVTMAVLGWIAWPLSALSYSKVFANRTLEFFGVVWARPTAIGGSEWEELLVGGLYGLVYSLIIILVM